VTGAPDGTWLDAALTVSVTVTVGCGLEEACAADAALEETPGVLAGDVLWAEAEVLDEAEVPDDADVAPVAVPGRPSTARSAWCRTACPRSFRAPSWTLLLRRADDVSFPAPGGRNRNQKGNA
jgi:hypothetical protein